jgi:uncharacterized membrane protein
VVLMVETTSSSSPSCAKVMDILLASKLNQQTSQLGVAGFNRTGWLAYAGAAHEDGMQVGAERADFFHRALVAADQPVVSQHCGHRDSEADSGHQ